MTQILGPGQSWQPPPAGFANRPIARNTIVNSDIGDMEWGYRGPTRLSPARRSTESYTDLDGIVRMDGTLLNQYTTAPSDGGREFNFVATATSMTLTMDMKLPASPSVASATVQLSICSGNTVLANTQCVLTATLTQYSVTASSLTVGTTYNARIHVQDSSPLTSTQARAFVANSVRVNQTTPSGFWTSFQRVPCLPHTMQDTLAFTQNNASNAVLSPMARLIVDTDATEVIVEYSGGLTTNNGIPIFVNGQLYAFAAPSTSSIAMTASIPLPSGWKRVEVWCGNKSQSGTWLSPTYSDMTIRAAYFPGTAVVILVPPVRGNKRCVAVGDSITAGFGPVGCNAAFGMSGLFRMAYPGQYIVEAWSGMSLAEMVCTGSIGPPSTAAWDATKGQAFVARLAQADPDEIIIGLGVNDWAGAGAAFDITVAAFGTAYGNLLDEIHLRMPRVKVWCLIPIDAANEAANSGVGGGTLGDYRTAITTAISTRTSYAEAVDGSAIFTSTTTGATADYADALHLNENGNRKLFEALRTAMKF